MYTIVNFWILFFTKTQIIDNYGLRVEYKRRKEMARSGFYRNREAGSLMRAKDIGSHKAEDHIYETIIL